MQSSERAIFREIVISSCRHVLPKCGLHISPDPRDLTEGTQSSEQLAAFIGFTAPVLRGALSLLAPIEQVRTSYPVVLKKGIAGKLELFDWAGEIVNRLLGRVKSEVAKRGIELEPSTPKAMLGEQLEFNVLQPSAVCAVEFVCGSGKITVLVDAVAMPGAALFGEPAQQSDLPQEGELLLF
jgi:CheY-specific phosphatase CheX